jgi:acyl-CoA synthetase (NDP forming)
LHLVNPKGGKIYGRQAATSRGAIGGTVDAALIMVPMAAIEATFDDLNASGIRNAVILTSGFAEMGEAGRHRQGMMSERGRERQISLLGPNCLGFINLLDRVPIWTSTFPTVRPGPIAIVSQSGATASYIADFAAQQGVGVG